MPEEPRDDDTKTTSPADAPDAPAGGDRPVAAEPRSALEQERDALHDRLLRTVAEFDNYRKRVERDRRELGDAIAADVLSELLPIIDDLDRALEAPDTGGTTAYRQGVELIHKQMLDLLRKRGARPLEAVGTDFDPRVHQAVVHEVSAAHREGEVMAELRRGYMIGDRLLRAAMVKVAKA